MYENLFENFEADEQKASIFQCTSFMNEPLKIFDMQILALFIPSRGLFFSSF